MSTAKIVIEKKEYEELKEKARILDNMNNKYQEPIVFRDKGNLEENYTKMIEIENQELKELKELKEKARKLDCLEENGVDNWMGYPDAMAMLEDEKDNTELDDDLEYIIEKGD